MKIQRKKTNRIEKINSLLQQLLGGILLPYLKNINAIVTISKVETSRDLKWAKIWITIINGEDEAVLKYLQNNIFEIQGELNRAMEVKIVPRISFHLDTSGRYAQHINEIFKQLEDERKSSDDENDDTESNRNTKK